MGDDGDDLMDDHDALCWIRLRKLHFVVNYSGVGAVNHNGLEAGGDEDCAVD